MKSIEKFGIRVLFITTCILVCLMLSCNLESSEFTSVMKLFGYTSLCVGILWFILRNKTENEVKNLLGISWIEKKTGLNFTEE